MVREYKKPTMTVEQFVANECVAACGDSGVVYKFKCDAGGGKYGEVYLETNGTEGLQTEGRNRDYHLSGYEACGLEHEAESTDDFLKGYYVPRKGGTRDVIVWRGPAGDNTHCTTELDMSKWETAKS